MHVDRKSVFWRDAKHKARCDFLIVSESDRHESTRRSVSVCGLVQCVTVAGVLATSCSVEADNPTTNDPNATGGGGAGTAGAPPSTPTAGTTSSTSGTSSGGSAVVGGQSSGGSAPTAGTGGTAPGGGGSSGGGAANGGSMIAAGAGGTNSGGTGTPGNYPLKNPPLRSAGCGTQGMQTLVSGGTAVQQGLATCSSRSSEHSAGDP